MTTPGGARRKFAEVIAFHIRDRAIPIQQVSRRARASVSDVQGWIDGTNVPTGEQWRALREGVSRDFNRYNELYREARTEHDDERNTLTRSMSKMSNRNGTPAPAQIGTSLAAKLEGVKVAAPAAPVVAAPAPASAPEAPRPAAPPNPGKYAHAHAHLGLEPSGALAKDGRVRSPARPDGSMTSEARHRRREYVRDFLRQRPHASANGPDGVVAAVRRTFGVGIDPAEIKAVRLELEQERALATRAAPAIEPAAAPAPAAPIVAISGPSTPGLSPTQVTHQPTAVNQDANIAAAVGLIVGEIPGLRSMTITVNDEGEASYTFEVRAVRTGGGVVRR